MHLLEILFKQQLPIAQLSTRLLDHSKRVSQVSGVSQRPARLGLLLFGRHAKIPAANTTDTREDSGMKPYDFLDWSRGTPG